MEIYSIFTEDLHCKDIFHKWIYRFNVISTKTPGNNFVDISTLTLKLIWRRERPRLANSVLKEKKKVSRVTLPNFKSYSNQDSVLLVKE